MKKDTSYVLNRAERFHMVLIGEGLLVGAVAGGIVLLYRLVLAYAGEWLQMILHYAKGSPVKMCLWFVILVLFAVIVRKAEDIPDPLSVMLIPSNVGDTVGRFLPLAGRVGNVPTYSTNRQINQSESGIDLLKQSVIRYLCLYPHAGMMLKIAVIDPPSVELMVSMLKKLNSDREFNISGIDVTIYRTKEATADWIEINDDSMNDGMLGQVKGKRSLNFRLKIANKKMPYAEILNDISGSQHMMIIFDPNEVKTETVKNYTNGIKRSKQITEIRSEKYRIISAKTRTSIKSGRRDV